MDESNHGWELDGFNSMNVAYLEALFAQYRSNPEALSPAWREYFASWQDETPPPERVPPAEEPGGFDLARTDPASVAQLLKKLPLFSDMETSHLEELAKITRQERMSADSVVSAAGQTVNDVLIILSGRVGVWRKDRLMAELWPGEVVGELAVLDPSPRSADLIAGSTLQVLRISKREFEDLLESRPGMMRTLLNNLAARLRRSGPDQERVERLIRAYRARGHMMASLDPLDRGRGDHPELSLGHYGFSEDDLDQRFTARLGSRTTGLTLRQIVKRLQATYCGSIGVQYLHIDDLEIQRWLRERLEDEAHQHPIAGDEQRRILAKLTDAEVFEHFLHRKFVGAKRFSLEGSESLIPMLDSAIEEAGRCGIEEVVIGMAHRGRLNVLANVMDKPAHRIFREFQDVDPGLQRGRGDVKYHLGYSSVKTTADGHEVKLSLCFNPSHLEFVSAVVLGRARARQDIHPEKRYLRALPLIIHGDAAFAGQGVIQESFNMSRLPGYTTGGAVHVVLNNQIGFTTPPEEGRSCQYATDVARMLQIPIFHVNGEDPGAVLHVTKLALAFRQTFAQDVVIDLYGYRKHGHNEGDDPSFTQPVMAAAIKRRRSVRRHFVDNLLKLGELTAEEAEAIATASQDRLEADLSHSQEEDYTYVPPSEEGEGREACTDDDPAVDTAIDAEAILSLMEGCTRLPEGFTPHPKIERFLSTDRAMARGELPFNWGAGEKMAFASLVTQGVPVRISGQDAGRGTFSHRHAVLYDHGDGHSYTPLQHLSAQQAPFEVFNSPLSEIGVLGFEYGYALDRSDGLVIWEAQFGDFSNVAQVIIDQFITSSEEKWHRACPIVLMLPHGFEGQGPEHSSARLERFLALAARDNIHVVNLTTPAQLFHCLRQHVLGRRCKPLIIMSPKSLLRHPLAVSEIDDFRDARFRPVMDDDACPDPDGVKRILLCSGKIYYELLEARRTRKRQDVAILRLEQLYPFPQTELRDRLARFPEATPVVWVQEEPWNMGAWFSLHMRCGDRLVGHGAHPFSAVTRPEAASPATGSAASHRLEQADLIDRAFSDLSD